MATYELQRQKGNVESTIKTVVNNDLKEICKAYNYQVSGTKAVLQKRCIEILDTIVKSGDMEAFRAFQHRLNHHGQAPPRASSSNYQNQNGDYSDSMAPGQGRSTASSSRWPSRLNFKASPFYEVLETVLPLQELAEMPQNRNTIRTNISLSPEQVACLSSDPSMKLLMYCGANAGNAAYTPIDVAFPSQIEVKINGDDVKWNFKGLKNKPGSTKPADITDKVRRKPGYPNQVSVTYALTQKRFAFTINLVKHMTADTLAQRIKEGRHGGGIISKQRVLDEMKSKADDEIGVTSVRMSLKDPISTLRITLPVRSTICTHQQCFDGAMFLQLQDQAPQWSCPLCSKSVNYEQLCIDKYFEEILQKTPLSIEKVDLEPDGQWHFIKETDESQPNGGTSKAGRAHYDDDFDDGDDLVDVTDSQAKSQPKNSLSGLARPTPSILSPMPSTGVAMNTPPLSSRGPSAAPSASSAQQSNKRPASSVIDLTLSDDDEPPRPAKRNTTSTHPNTTYSTPNSLPDPRYPSYPSGQGRVADSFRAGNSSRPPSLGPSNGAGNYYPSNGLGGSSLARGTASPVQPREQPGSPWGIGGGRSSTDGQPSWRTAAGASTGPSSTFGSFPMRPSTTSATHPGSSASPAQQNTRPLPPMRDHPPAGPYGHGWRSNSYSGYSHSPPG
ncbi:E3 SUMO- ligase pli1 [Lecanosticta acicola]|uniref:E3 SUMO- ligase pli1 n=1 Tax=Lecanosticta acicola TaxID=111012 RepID=A0AAI8YW24_9PEZI|nr:E3 SUMO- ligase pli1 [Lecanosticta acicola]